MGLLGKIKGKLMDEVSADVDSDADVQQRNDDLSYRARLIRELVAEFNRNNFLRTHFREK